MHRRGVPPGSAPEQRSAPAQICLREHFRYLGTLGDLCGRALRGAAVQFLPPGRGEVIVSEALGLVPVLGAYLVQAGDLTRTVYLASLPLVVATALWVWTDKLITRTDDGKEGRQTMVILFGPRFSGRFGALALSVLLGATLAVAVLTASIGPWALVAVLSFGLVWKIVAVSWKEYGSPTRMFETRKRAFTLHLVTCIIIAATSLIALRS